MNNKKFLFVFIIIAVLAMALFFVFYRKPITRLIKKAGPTIISRLPGFPSATPETSSTPSTNPVVSPAPGQKDPLFFQFHYELQAKQPTLFTDHPLIDAVMMNAFWPIIEPKKGQFDFSLLDKNIYLWHQAGKNVGIGVAPYGQANGNNLTPQWVKDSVPCLTFSSKKESRGDVTIPIVWNEEFIKNYSNFIKQLAQKYDTDPRVKYIGIGIGHIGYTTAQPSKEGEEAFLKAGWTLKNWETYTKKIIDLYAQNFKNKKLIIGVSPLFTRDYPLANHLDVGQRIVDYAAQKNYLVLFKEIDEDMAKFEQMGIPALIKNLAQSNYPNLQLGFGDDWPLYGQTGSKTRNADDFQSILDNIYNLWLSINKKYQIFLVTLDNEMAASQPGNSQFNQTVYQAMNDFLNKIK